MTNVFPINTWQICMTNLFDKFKVCQIRPCFDEFFFVNWLGIFKSVCLDLEAENHRA